MGQYWIPVNLDKKEFIHPHRLGSGLKLCEQLYDSPGVGAALIILTAAQRENRGGGDLDLDENWHGPERTFPKHNICPAPMPDEYAKVARRTIGRWAGDRITIIGDYAEDGDLPSEFEASKIYDRCKLPGDEKEDADYIDITNDVCAVIEHECRGAFTGNGWRRFKNDE